MRALWIRQLVSEGVIADNHGMRFNINRIIVPEEDNLAITVHEDTLYVFKKFSGPHEVIGEFEISKEWVAKALAVFDATQEAETLFAELFSRAGEVCDYCHQVMGLAFDCSANHVVKNSVGIELPAIPYDPLADVYCIDCGVAPGNYHHPGCSAEICPHCHGQRITHACESR